MTLSSKSQVSNWGVFVSFVFLLIEWSVVPDNTEFPCNVPSEVLSRETIETNSILTLLWIAQTKIRLTGEKAGNVSPRFYRKKNAIRTTQTDPVAFHAHHGLWGKMHFDYFSEIKSHLTDREVALCLFSLTFRKKLEKTVFYEKQKN